MNYRNESEFELPIEQSNLAFLLIKKKICRLRRKMAIEHRTSFISLANGVDRHTDNLMTKHSMQIKAKVRYYTPEDGREQLPAPTAGRFPSRCLRGTGDDVRSSKLWSKMVFFFCCLQSAFQTLFDFERILYSS